MRSAFAAVIAGFLFLAGCSAVFVAPYDEATDRLLTDLSVKTETTLVKGDSGQLSAEERGQFFDDALGTVRTIKARASLFQKNEDEVAALGQLEQRYLDLKQHGGTPRSSIATGLRATLLDLQQIQIAKKRSFIFSSGLKKTNQ